MARARSHTHTRAERELLPLHARGRTCGELDSSLVSYSLPINDRDSESIRAGGTTKRSVNSLRGRGWGKRRRARERERERTEKRSTRDKERWTRVKERRVEITMRRGVARGTGNLWVVAFILSRRRLNAGLRGREFSAIRRLFPSCSLFPPFFFSLSPPCLSPCPSRNRSSFSLYLPNKSKSFVNFIRIEKFEIWMESIERDFHFCKIYPYYSISK